MFGEHPGGRSLLYERLKVEEERELKDIEDWANELLEESTATFERGRYRISTENEFSQGWTASLRDAFERATARNLSGSGPDGTEANETNDPLTPEISLNSWANTPRQEGQHGITTENDGKLDSNDNGSDNGDFDDDDDDDDDDDADDDDDDYDSDGVEPVARMTGSSSMCDLMEGALALPAPGKKKTKARGKARGKTAKKTKHGESFALEANRAGVEDLAVLREFGAGEEIDGSLRNSRKKIGLVSTPTSSFLKISKRMRTVMRLAAGMKEHPALTSGASPHAPPGDALSSSQGRVHASASAPDPGQMKPFHLEETLENPNATDEVSTKAAAACKSMEMIDTDRSTHSLTLACRRMLSRETQIDSLLDHAMRSVGCEYSDYRCGPGWDEGDPDLFLGFRSREASYDDGSRGSGSPVKELVNESSSDRLLLSHAGWACLHDESGRMLLSVKRLQGQRDAVPTRAKTANVGGQGSRSAFANAFGSLPLEHGARTAPNTARGATARTAPNTARDATRGSMTERNTSATRYGGAPESGPHGQLSKGDLLRLVDAYARDASGVDLRSPALLHRKQVAIHGHTRQVRNRPRLPPLSALLADCGPQPRRSHYPPHSAPAAHPSTYPPNHPNASSLPSGAHPHPHPHPPSHSRHHHHHPASSQRFLEAASAPAKHKGDGLVGPFDPRRPHTSDGPSRSLDTSRRSSVVVSPSTPKTPPVDPAAHWYPYPCSSVPTQPVLQHRRLVHQPRPTGDHAQQNTSRASVSLHIPTAQWGS
eukprot:Rmarinus@m.13072